MKNTEIIGYVLGAVAFCIWTGGTPLPAQQPRKADAAASLADADYGTGIHAMNEGRWNDAVSSFLKSASDPNGIHGDASLYWEAYSYRRLGLRRQSMQTCGMLRSTFRESTWNQDCDALLLEMKQNRGSYSQESGKELPPIPPATGGVGADDDLKLLALNALLHRSPEQGVAAARRMLQSGSIVATKQQVLFVLTQSPSEDTELLLSEAMRGSFGAAIQTAAIRTVVQYSAMRAVDVVLAAYRGSRSVETKEAAIDALAKWQDWRDLVTLAKEERDPVLRRRVVSTLSKTDDPIATKFLEELLR
jgi:hypothetical protein